VGTADLDLHLSLHLLDGETAEYYDSIIVGLRGLGLSPDHHDGRPVKWRWIGTHRGARLQVEFLCPARRRAGRPEAPAESTTAELNIGPSDEITALAVGFGHLVASDTVMIERAVDTSRGQLLYEFPVAGIASWLCLKTDAIMRRDKPKDAYDVVRLISALGPQTAARQVLTARCSTATQLKRSWHNSADSAVSSPTSIPSDPGLTPTSPPANPELSTYVSRRARSRGSGRQFSMAAPDQLSPRPSSV